MIFRPHVWQARFIAPRDPGTAAIAGLNILGTGLGIAGQAQRAQADAAQASYMAQVARNNQALAEINARHAEDQGAAAAARQQLQTAQLIGRQRSALAAQGGDVNSGSDLDLLGDTARAGAADTATTRNDAAWKAWSYRQQGLDSAASANAAEARAGAITGALPYGIGSSLLGGAERLTPYWLKAFPSATPGIDGGRASSTITDGIV
jgi:hypothetical protein